MSIENQPTQRLRRPSEPPMPGSLDPTRPQPTVEPASDGSTDMLSLDNLFEEPQAAATPQAAPAPQPQPLPPVPAERRVAERRVTDRRVGVVPVATAAAPAARQKDHSHRLRHDSSAALRGGVAAAGHWVTSGDNPLIVVTALVALALVLVVGLV